MSQLVHSLEALDLCAQKMDTLSANDEARADVRAIYLVAGQVHAACMATPQAQTDPRVPVPDWLVPEEPRLSTSHNATKGATDAATG